MSSLIDIGLTNVPNMFSPSVTMDTGSSDGHLMIINATKSKLPKPQPRTITYRSYKNFIEADYVRAISMIPFSVTEIFDDPSDSLWAQETLIRDVLDEHAPLKSKKVRAREPPFLHKKLKKEIMNKARLRHRLGSKPSHKSWEAYRAQRNKTTGVRRWSVKQYFKERCGGGAKNADFHKTINPFISTKTKTGSSLTIREENKLYTEPVEVAEIMNSHYISIANQIGTDKSIPQSCNYSSTDKFVAASTNYHKDHPSIKAIKSECNTVNDFQFKHVYTEQVKSVIDNLDVKKSTGADRIPAKALVLASEYLAPQFAQVFNKCVDAGKFPDGAKIAEVAPIYKKADPLEKKNHRPVSVLTSSSKIFEKIIEHQLSADFLHEIYHDSLSAFRSGYSCQHVLLHLCDQWRQALENKSMVAILLLDLSKAFDCLPHSLIIAKLEAYGVSSSALNLLADYLSNRKQRVKVGGAVSKFDDILKGVPQGSILGPVLFNVFMNDIFCAIKDGILFNYADDNTVLVKGKNKPELLSRIEKNSKALIEWVTINEMEANPSKFELMISNESNSTTEFKIDNCTINSEPVVKLLGVFLDNKLNFSHHISNICKKACRQLNCLKRFANYLDEKSKLLLYKSFIISHFNYCPAVWHACGHTNTVKLEKIQYRALKFIYNDHTSDYETLLKRANMPTLQLSRLHNIAIEVFKAYNKMSPEYINALFSKPTHNYSLRSKNTLYQTNKNSTKGGLHSFQHIGTQIWNSLPNECRTTTDYKTFKTLLKTWTGLECKCNFCKSGYA